MAFPKDREEKQFRVIYEALYDKPRIFYKNLGDVLHISSDKASIKMQKAIKLGWFFNPQVRARSYANLMEYTYFLKCKNPARYFSEFINKESIIYHALTGGCANMWVVSKEELDFSCKNVVSGPRSDYLASFPPNHSWDTGIHRMQKKVEEFNPKDYEPEGLIKTHWNKTIEWDSEYEELFKEFNYDLRKPITPIMKKHLISWKKVDNWMKNLQTYCTIITGYYPGGIKSYDPYLFMLETDYEDFIVNLFSELPTTTIFFKVSNKLFVYAYVRREYIRFVSSQVHINRLQIHNLLLDLLEKGVILSENHGIVECYWQKDIHPGIPP